MRSDSVSAGLCAEDAAEGFGGRSVVFAVFAVIGVVLSWWFERPRPSPRLFCVLSRMDRMVQNEHDAGRGRRHGAIRVGVLCVYTPVHAVTSCGLARGVVVMMMREMGAVSTHEWTILSLQDPKVNCCHP